MKYIYILAENEEHGIEVPWVATLDRERIVDLFKEKWPDHVAPYEAKYGWRNQQTRMIDPIANLVEFLAKPDTELSDETKYRLGGHSFFPGWGGPKLYVLRLS